MANTFYPYSSPINPALYPSFTVLLYLVGLFFFSLFFIYELTSGSRRRKNLFTELVLAFAASVFLGWGTLFLLLWTGVYV